MRRRTFLGKLIISYFMLVLVATCVSLIITATLIADMREHEVVNRQRMLTEAVQEMDSLFESYYLRSAYLGTNTTMLKSRVTASSVMATDAVDLLRSTKSYEKTIKDVFVFYDTDAVYCADGMTRAEVFFTQHCAFPESEVENLRQILQDGSKRFEIFNMSNGESCLFLHYPIRAAGEKAAVSINYLLIDGVLTSQLKGVLAVPGTYIDIHTQSGYLVSYQDFSGDVVRMTQQAVDQEQRFLIENTSETTGLTYRAYYDEGALFADSILLNRQIILITLIITTFSLATSYFLALRNSKPVKKLNQLATSMATAQQVDVYQNEFVNIETQLRFLYGRHTNLVETNQMRVALQRQQTAMLIFHGVLTTTEDIEHHLNALAYASFEMYYFLELLVVVPNAEQAADQLFQGQLFEKTINSDQVQYVLLVELPNSDGAEEYRQDTLAQQSRKLPQGSVMTAQYSAVYDDLSDIAQAYQSLASYQNAQQGEDQTAGTPARQVAWSEIYRLLDAYGSAIQHGDLDSILACLADVQETAQTTPAILADIRHEMLIRTSFYLLRVVESGKKNVDLLYPLTDATNVDDEGFWNIIQKTLQVFFAQEENTDTISKAIIYIDQNFRRSDLTLIEVAEHIGLEKFYFSKKFKEETGKKYIDYLSELRMKEAKRLVEETNLKTPEIANAVGYLDPASFRKKFQAYWGHSIQEYRQNLQEGNQ